MSSAKEALNTIILDAVRADVVVSYELRLFLKELDTMVKVCLTDPHADRDRILLRMLDLLTMVRNC